MKRLKRTGFRVALLGLLAVVFALSGCAPVMGMLDAFTESGALPIPGGYSLEVRNLCGGANIYVDVFIDGSYRGQVFYTETFYGIPYGSHSLMAIGTGGGGSNFIRTIFFNDDYIWTLCS